MSFLFTAPSPTAIYTLSLHDALPISELLDDRPVRRHVLDDDVHPSQCRSQRHVRTLHVEPARGLGRTGQLAALRVEPAAKAERELSFRQRVVEEVARPGLEHRVARDE